MKAEKSNLKRTLAKVAAGLQVVIGALLLVGTIGLTFTAYRTVRHESEMLAGNLNASADALDSSCASYKQSATNLFGLTDAIDDVAVKLAGVSDAVSRTGERFVNYGEPEKTSFWDKWRPFGERFKNTGEKLKEVAVDVEAVSDALKRQSKTIKDYRDDGYEKSLDAMSKISESLRNTAKSLDSEHSTCLWCGFVCILGFCVSMLFFANGALLFLFAKIETKMAT